MPSNVVSAELVWTKDLTFGATSGESALILDGDSAAGPSPMQLLVFALAGCMAMDVIDILRKGRHHVGAFRVSLRGERNPDPPRRLLTVSLVFHVHGTVAGTAVERAIGLSRDKYCSVWHSMRPDIEMRTSYEIVAERKPPVEPTQDSG